jgi:hypothetical protein
MDLHEAIKVATDAHEGQLDKGGRPYILHPLRVMMAMEETDEQIVAVLHDVIEDTGIKLVPPEMAGVPNAPDWTQKWALYDPDTGVVHGHLDKHQAEALEAITRREGEIYLGD